MCADPCVFLLHLHPHPHPKMRHQEELRYAYGSDAALLQHQRAYHDAIYEEEYGSETEEDCCRGRGFSAILCWFLSVIVLVGVAASVVLTVFFILKSRAPGTGLDELSVVFNEDTGFSAVPTTPRDLPIPSSASSEEDAGGESTGDTGPPPPSLSSTRRPHVYVDSSEYRYRGNNRDRDSHPQHPHPTTFSTRSSSTTKMTTRRYYSDTTGQSMEDVIAKTTEMPATPTTESSNVFKVLMNTIRTYGSQDEFTPSQSNSASESLEKSVMSNDEGGHSDENTRDHRGTTSITHSSEVPEIKLHGTTLFTSAPSTVGQTRPTKVRNKPKQSFGLLPSSDGGKLSSSSSEELVDGTTIPPPLVLNSSEERARFPKPELPAGKKVPAGVKASVEDYTTHASTVSTMPTTQRDDLFNKLIRNRNPEQFTTTRRTVTGTTVTPDSSESKEQRRPGKARTVIYKTTTTAMPSNIVLVTPSTTDSSEEALKDGQKITRPSLGVEVLDHPRVDTTKSPQEPKRPEVDLDSSSSDSSEDTKPIVVNNNQRPKNESNEFLDILVGNENSKTLITKQTDSGVITSAILPPWYNNNGDDTRRNENRDRDRPERFRQPDLTALLDILSSPESNNSVKSETYNVKEVDSDASQKAERLKHLEEELKPVFSSPSDGEETRDQESQGSRMPPTRLGSQPANSFHYPMDGGKTNVYGFFPGDDLDVEESSEQLQIEISPNRPANRSDYDSSADQSETDHVIDIAYDAKTRPEIQLELGDSFELESEEEVQDSHFGHRAPLHTGSGPEGPSFAGPKATAPVSVSVPPPPPPPREKPMLVGSMASASEPAQVKQPVSVSSESADRVPLASEESYEREPEREGDWSVKTEENKTNPAQIPNSLEEYSEEDPNYALASMEAAELNLQREKANLSKPVVTSTTTTTTTTQKPKTKVIQVFSEPYVPPNASKTSDPKTSTTPPPEYDYSLESVENKTGFVPPNPISFHEGAHNFQSPEPEYNSKDGWRPLVVSDRRGTVQNHPQENNVKFQGSSRPPPPPPGPGPNHPLNRRPVTTLPTGQSSEYQDYPEDSNQRQQGPPIQQQPQPPPRPPMGHPPNQDSWSGMSSPYSNSVQPPPVKMVAPPPRMKFPEASQDQRVAIKLPQPQRHHPTTHGIDRTKYSQRPAVPPIIMRRFPSQNPTQTTQAMDAMIQNQGQNPHVATPVRHIHRGPQFLPNMAPPPNIRQGPQGPMAPSGGGNVNWPSENQNNNALRRNSHYLMNQRRQG